MTPQFHNRINPKEEFDEINELVLDYNMNFKVYCKYYRLKRIASCTSLSDANILFHLNAPHAGGKEKDGFPLIHTTESS